MFNRNSIKLNIVDIILRIIPIVILAYCLFDLFLIFIFNAFTQSAHDPKLRFWQFEIPFLLTMLSIIFVLVDLIDGRFLAKFQNLHFVIKILLAILLVALIGLQLWYIIPSVANSPKNFSANVPFLIAMLCTIIVLTKLMRTTESKKVGASEIYK